MNFQWDWKCSNSQSDEEEMENAFPRVLGWALPLFVSGTLPFPGHFPVFSYIAVKLLGERELACIAKTVLVRSEKSSRGEAEE